MPQLDPTSFPSQLFWLAVSFVALYVLMAWLLLPRVQSVLVARERAMQGDIEQAERLKSEAARAEEQYEKAHADAKTRSQALLAQAHMEIAARSAGRKTELDGLTEQKLVEAEAAIRHARRSIEEKLTPMAADLASLIVETLVHQKPDSKAIGNAINEVTREKSL